jgi:capsular exopolysaccharide synthesis family protein
LTLIGVIGAGSASFLIRPTYTAETQLFVAIQNSGSAAELAQGNTFSQARVQSYVKTVTTPVVLQPVIDSLGLQTTPEDLAKHVKASTDLNTVLINIAVDQESPAQASSAARAVGESLIKAVDQLERPASGPSPVRLSVIKPAVAPTTPSAPNPRLYLIIGAALGLAAGIAAAFAREAFDNKIHGEKDIREVTEAPIIGGIAFDAEAPKRPLVTDVSSHSPRAESFKQLRTNMQFTNVGHQKKAVMITSSIPGEGKTTTAVNLAITLSQAGQSVALVDADLRRPKVGEYLGLEIHAGLTTALLGSINVDDLMQPWGDGSLFVLASGQIPPNPSELLASKEMLELIEDLEEKFDAVIIDAPPVLPVTDAAVLSQHVGGTILVVSAQKTKRGELGKTIAALDLVGAKFLGIVINRVSAKGPDAYSYGYSSYEPDIASSDVARSDRSRTSRRNSKLKRGRVQQGPSEYDEFQAGMIFDSDTPVYSINSASRDSSRRATFYESHPSTDD